MVAGPDHERYVAEQVTTTKAQRAGRTSCCILSSTTPQTLASSSRPTLFCVYIDHPPCKMHTVCIWRILHEGVCVYSNGAPSFHDGTSDWKHWDPIDWSNLAENATSMFYGRAYPPRATVIEGNTHAPHPNGSAVLLIAAEGLQLTANEFGKRTPTGQLKDNVALLATCSDGALCSATNVFMKANTGFSAATTNQSSAVSRSVLTNRGLLHLLPTKQAYHGHVGLHTWFNEDPAPLFAPHNLIGSGSRSESPANPFAWIASDGACNITQPHKTRSDQQFGEFHGCHVPRQCLLCQPWKCVNGGLCCLYAQ
jgi:hypothetical protein